MILAMMWHCVTRPAQYRATVKGALQYNHDITHITIWPYTSPSCPTQYLQQQLSLETCVAVLTLAHRHNCADLRAEAVSGPAAALPCVVGTFVAELRACSHGTYPAVLLLSTPLVVLLLSPPSPLCHVLTTRPLPAPCLPRPPPPPRC
jgi:hypothetical protein